MVKMWIPVSERRVRWRCETTAWGESCETSPRHVKQTEVCRHKHTAEARSTNTRSYYAAHSEHSNHQSNDRKWVSSCFENNSIFHLFSSEHVKHTATDSKPSDLLLISVTFGLNIIMGIFLVFDIFFISQPMVKIICKFMIKYSQFPV